MNTRLTLFFALLVTSIYAWSQVTPSPSAMGSVNSSREDLYRGYVSEVVPLYTIQAKNNFTVPIQLVYQTKGIRVEEEASPVGLGWNLVAGGAITRVVRDEPDEQSTFRETLEQDHLRRKEVNNEKGYDYQKDVFYFSYPGGSGRFISTSSRLNATNNTSFQGLPYNDLKISMEYTSDTESKWTITDLSGVKYVFGENANARELTTAKSYPEGQSANPDKEFTYIATWYLEKIIFPNLSEENNIVFIYEKEGNEFTQTSYSTTCRYNLNHVDTYWSYKGAPGADCSILSPGDGSCDDYFTLLKSLPGGDGFESMLYFVSNSQEVYYYRLYDEPCGTGYACEEPWKGPKFVDNLEDPNRYIETAHPIYETVKDNNYGDKKYFSQSTFKVSKLTGINSLDAHLAFDYSSRSDVVGMSKMHQLLVKDDNNNIIYNYDLVFNYFIANSEEGATTKDRYRLKLESINQNNVFYRGFNYMDESSATYKLPSKRSIKKDIYGYYNSAVTSEFSGVSYDLDEFNSINIPGSKRESSNTAKANMLWKVVYPIGGTREYDYVKSASGGVLINKILVQADGQTVGHKEYTFSTNFKKVPLLYAQDGGSVYLFSDSPNLTFDYNSLNGHHTCTVTDMLQNNETKYWYYAWSLEGQESYENTKEKRLLNNWSNVEELDSDVAPYMSYPYRNPAYGLIRYVEVKDDLENNVSLTEYVYDNSTTGELKEHAFVSLDDNTFNVGESLIHKRALYLDKIKTTRYEDGQELQTVQDFNYLESKPTLHSFVEHTLSDGSGKKVEYTYPFDICASTPSTATSEAMGYCHMKARHIIGSPVQTVQKYKSQLTANYKITGASFGTFHEIGSNIVPYHTYSLELAAPIDEGTLEEVTIDDSQTTAKLAYDSRFNLINTFNYLNNGNLNYQINSSSGIRTDYTWDDNNSLIVSKRVNGFTTTYEHVPLVGVTRITDPNGKSTSYEYDKFNRLRLVRDHNENIVERYRYYYKAENTGITPGIVIYGKNKTGISIDFGLQDEQFFYGETRYIWDFGDGEENEGTSASTNHTYATAGDHTVKITMINPEYETVEVSKAYSVKSVDYVPGICAEYYSYSQCDGSFHGTVEDDACTTGSEPYFLFTGSANDGAYCEGELKVNWSYRLDGVMSSVEFGEGASALVPEALITNLGGHAVFCTVTDICGYTYSSEIQFATTDTCIE